MLKKHESTKGLGTIASKLVADPSRYGVLIVDDASNKILQFLEKSEYYPQEGRNVAMPVNAGVYILEPDIFSHIEPHIKVSIELDVFPKLSKENELFHYPISGIWKDIGKPEELLEGNILLMNDLIEENKENLIDDSVKFNGKVLIYPPVTIGENVVIGNDCIIGPNVIIGNNVFIDEKTEIKEALVYSNNSISKNVKIENAIISDNCLIQDNAVLLGNDVALVILASGVVVSSNIRVITNTNTSISICHHEIVKENKISSEYFTSESIGD